MVMHEVYQPPPSPHVYTVQAPAVCLCDAWCIHDIILLPIMICSIHSNNSGMLCRIKHLVAYGMHIRTGVGIGRSLVGGRTVGFSRWEWRSTQSSQGEMIHVSCLAARVHHHQQDCRHNPQSLVVGLWEGGVCE